MNYKSSEFASLRDMAGWQVRECTAISCSYQSPEVHVVRLEAMERLLIGIGMEQKNAGAKQAAEKLEIKVNSKPRSAGAEAQVLCFGIVRHD